MHNRFTGGSDGPAGVPGPFPVAAARFPVGNVANGYADAVFFESAADVIVGNVIAEQAIDQIALEVGQTGNFAVPGLLFGFRLRENCQRRDGGGFYWVNIKRICLELDVHSLG